MRRGLVIATTNRGKLREIRSVLADLDVDLASLEEFGRLPEAVEDGHTFEDNAERKALHYARLTGWWALADDSGLEVDALGQRPGVNSARFAGPTQDPQANNAKLVASLQDIPPARRAARFRCVVAVADAQRVLAAASGVLEGQIVDRPRGENGFGYDPHFLVPELGRTVAQLDADHKNPISHRGQAVRNIRPKLEALLRTV